jgi:hypothetical protein
MAELFVKGINGQMWVNHERVLISKKGVLPTLLFGKGKERIIELSHIQKVDFQSAGWSCNGFLHFTIKGTEEKITDMGKARKDENALVFNGENNLAAVKVRNFIEKIINNRKAAE